MHLFFNSNRLFTVFFEEIKKSRTNFSFEIHLWVQVPGGFVLIMAINMPAPTTASGALANADDDLSACHKQKLTYSHLHNFPDSII